MSQWLVESQQVDQWVCSQAHFCVAQMAHSLASGHKCGSRFSVEDSWLFIGLLNHQFACNRGSEGGLINTIVLPPIRHKAHLRPSSVSKILCRLSTGLGMASRFIEPSEGMYELGPTSKIVILLQLITGVQRHSGMPMGRGLIPGNSVYLQVFQVDNMRMTAKHSDCGARDSRFQLWGCLFGSFDSKGRDKFSASMNSDD